MYQEIACEAWRIKRRNHELPTDAAVSRMLDTVWRAGDAEAVPALDAPSPAPRHVSVGHWACGCPGESGGPADVSGTSMRAERSRPRPPRPPKR